jgi:hypothetical protein
MELYAIGEVGCYGVEVEVLGCFEHAVAVVDEHVERGGGNEVERWGGV